AQVSKVVHVGGDPGQVAEAVAVGVGERARVDLIENGLSPPLWCAGGFVHGRGRQGHARGAGHQASLAAESGAAKPPLRGAGADTRRDPSADAHRTWTPATQGA